MGLHNLSFLQNPIQHGKGGRIFLHNYPPNQYKAFIKYFFEAVQNLTSIVYILLLLNIFYLFIFIKSFNMQYIISYNLFGAFFCLLTITTQINSLLYLIFFCYNAIFPKQIFFYVQISEFYII